MSTAVIQTYSQKVGFPRLDNSSVVSSWRFENNVVDSVGVNNGVYQGVNNYGSAPIGYGVDFGHNSSLIEINNNTNLSLTNGTNDIEKSFTCLIKFDDTNANYIFHKNDATNKEYQLNYNATFLQFVIFDGASSSNSLRQRVDFTPTINKWYHIAITYDGNGNIKIYIDGIDSSYVYNVGSYISNSNKSTKFKIGARDYNSDQIFTGELDELRVFNIELTPEEVLHLATKEKSGNRIIG